MIFFFFVPKERRVISLIFFCIRYNFNINEAMLTAHSGKPLLRTRAALFLHRHQWMLVSNTSQIVFYVVLCLVCIITSILVLFFDHTTSPLPCYAAQTLPLALFEGVVCATFSLIFLAIFIVTPDAFAFKWEFGIILFTGIPCLIMWCIAFQLAWLGPTSVNLWISVGEITFLIGTFIVPIILSYYFTALLRRNRKHTNDDESSTQSAGGLDELKAVLEDETLSAHFERFAVKSWAAENVVFYRKVQQFRATPQDKILQEATSIYRNFIAVGRTPPFPASPFAFPRLKPLLCCLPPPDSFYQLNVDMSLREKIFEHIDTKQVDHALFDEAETHALGLLRFSVYPLWKASSDFRAALAKLKITDLRELSLRRFPRKSSSSSGRIDVLELQEADRYV